MELPRPVESPSSPTLIGLTEEPSAAPEGWDWEALDAALRPRLISLGIRRFRLRREESEDAVQSVFTNVLGQDARVRDPVAYIKASFLNACRNILLGKKRLSGDEPDCDLPDPVSGALAGRIEAACAVSGAFRRIEPRCRDLIRSYFLEDRPLAETAVQNGYSQKTVWKRINRCLEKMRQCLS
ncbi:MAG TPA: sigma-70 family RNA polymerase sigma factor [Thermoanaerobaculia bacterium]|nr:sigma-70 family RNA polymerase sigma factor [Thermoanaerobaculia bacterium]